MKNRYLSIPLLLAAMCTGPLCPTPLLGQAPTNWSFNYSGSIVTWSVPQAGTYAISAAGAQGGNLSGRSVVPGGLGAVMGGDFDLTGVSSLSILVGGQGGNKGGGGGGTFVVAPSNTPLVVAGGGGGASIYGINTGDASTGTSGNSGFSIGGSGGTGGNGGAKPPNSEHTNAQGAGGGGFFGNGESNVYREKNEASGGSSYTNGGAGGTGGKWAGGDSDYNGGFGGGGQAGAGGGGGGGYSGGGAGGVGGSVLAIAKNNGYFGGGGGSYLAGSAANQTMSVGNTGPGLVKISLLGAGDDWGGDLIRDLPSAAKFHVTQATQTIGETNTIHSLLFTNSASLAIDPAGQLTVGSGSLNVQSGTSVVSGGTLATPSNFSKTGPGELDLQSNAFSGEGSATVAGGTLRVNGLFSADSLVVEPNATIGGEGTIVIASMKTRETLHNHVKILGSNLFGLEDFGLANIDALSHFRILGNLSPGNSPGTLTIVGNLDLTGANSTLIEIASPTNFDRIVVFGTTALGGTLNIVPYGGYQLAYGQRYAILTAGGGITGEFDEITAPETFRGRFLNQGTTGTLLIAPDSYTRVAVTPNQRQVAKALDSFIPATSGDRETVSIALDSLTAEQYPSAFDQITPGFYESLANIAIEQTYNQAQLLTQRMGSVRLGATGFQAIGISQPIKYDKDGKSVADAKTASPIVESAVSTNWNSWVIANGEFSISRGLAGVPNYNNNAGGFLVGADYRLSENFAAGLFAGYEYSYAKYNGGSSTQGNSALFGLYGSYTHEDGYYADAVVSGGYTGFQTRRSIEFGTIDRTARANPNSGQFSAALNLGKDFEIGKFTLGPIIGAQYTYAGIGGFTETGAESLDLALGQQNANSLRTNLGARLAYNWEVGAKVTLIPELRGFWMHEFLNNPRNISSALDGGSSSSFDYETSAPYRNSVFGGAGISAKFADRWTASVFYNVNFGAESYTNNIISTSLNFAF